MFSDRALLPKRKTPPAVGAKEIASLGLDLVVILSHNHYDHFDKKSVRDLPDSARFIVPLGLGEQVRGLGKSHVTEMN